MKRVLRLVERVFCRHIDGSFFQDERDVMMDPWSSETGYKVQVRQIRVCTKCGRVKHLSRWKTIKRFEYGTGGLI